VFALNFLRIWTVFRSTLRGMRRKWAIGQPAKYSESDAAGKLAALRLCLKKKFIPQVETLHEKAVGFGAWRS